MKKTIRLLLIPMVLMAFWSCIEEVEPTGATLPASMVQTTWKNPSNVWIYSIGSNTTGNFIRTNNVLYFYNFEDVSVDESGALEVYTVSGVADDGTQKTFHLKQPYSNRIDVSGSSATSGFGDFYLVLAHEINKATYSTGSFSYVSTGTWTESNGDGTFNFEELGYDQLSVFLRKDNNGGDVEIDLENGEIFHTPIGGSKTKLYDITTASK